MVTLMHVMYLRESVANIIEQCLDVVVRISNHDAKGSQFHYSHGHAIAFLPS